MSGGIRVSSLGQSKALVEKALTYLGKCDLETRRYLLEDIPIVLPVAGVSTVTVKVSRVLIAMGYNPKVQKYFDGELLKTTNDDGWVSFKPASMVDKAGGDKKKKGASSSSGRRGASSSSGGGASSSSRGPAMKAMKKVKGKFAMKVAKKAPMKMPMKGTKK